MGRRKILHDKSRWERSNVNRLVKHHMWDDIHTCTDMPAETRRTHALETPPKIGDLIVFPTTYNEQHKCVFGVGKILELNSVNNMIFQWLGNKPLAEASKPFAPGWVDPRDNKGYYASRPIHISHPPWTNRDTCTEVTVSSIIAKGDILNAAGRINNTTRAIIEASVGESISWGA